eukprot:CAMPEP_0184389190 /NCGR_PEP_ID=MMETSP0007-20130409/12263_1 /TAXON_ID=97485 /ORGANISM="Prymnesium parvum, Strain Texoma1" /LENGTH=56 /DNA_ID=CAMNT_0026738389 /DNA_START=89 /DNA_END=256 /DNA_ORIENTATION=-
MAEWMRQATRRQEQVGHESPRPIARHSIAIPSGLLCASERAKLHRSIQQARKCRPN